MSSIQKILCRPFSTSKILMCDKDFKKMNLYELRMSESDKVSAKKHPSAIVMEQHDRGIRNPGTVNCYLDFTHIPEMEPEIVVPDLTGFELKPYVSYRVTELKTPKFTAQDLFYAVYSNKIKEDFNSNKLNEDGSSEEPSPEESLSQDEAKQKARMTGSDIYGHDVGWLKY